MKLQALGFAGIAIAMSRFAPAYLAIPVAAAGAVALAVAGALAQDASAPRGASAPPDFQSNEVGWITINTDLVAPGTGIGPTKSDPAHPYIRSILSGAQPTFRISDTTNPNLKPWAVEAMKKDNAEVLAGKVAFTARSSCMPAGVPGFSSFNIEPVYFMQSPKEILMVYSGNSEVRHIYMNVPHSKSPKPSWHGESVGHYEGDTLVVDTTGLNAKTFVDNYRAPRTEKIHVVERYRLVEDGKVLEANLRVEDPDTFNQPWSGIQRYRKVQRGPLEEQACAENNNVLFDFGIPTAAKADF